MYINIESQEVVSRIIIPSMSLPSVLTDDLVRSLGYTELLIAPRPPQLEGRVITEGTVTQKDGVYTLGWSIDDTLVDVVGDLRRERDHRLLSSDYTQASDYPKPVTDQTLWATYRQVLRDLPANTPDPENVTWPIAPNAGDKGRAELN
jgi:hypothetical protein